MSESRFWRIEDPAFPGEFYYIDHRDIRIVEKVDDSNNENPEDDRVYFAMTLTSGESYEMTTADGLKMMKWAESLSESIPEVSLNGNWK